MSELEWKALVKISKAGWKQLAKVDQSDGDDVVVILKEVLEGIDQITESEERK